MSIFENVRYFNHNVNRGKDTPYLFIIEFLGIPPPAHGRKCNPPHDWGEVQSSPVGKIATSPMGKIALSPRKIFGEDCTSPQSWEEMHFRPEIFLGESATLPSGEGCTFSQSWEKSNLLPRFGKLDDFANYKKLSKSF